MLSLCMIVKNEENCLKKSLESVKNLADEIIVVDTGSTDNTVRVAKDMGAEIFYYDWCDDFSEARNFSLSKAKGEWILFMDADEVIAPQDIEKIIELINTPSGIAGYFFIQRNYTHDTRRQNFTPCNGKYPQEESGVPGFVPVERIALFRNDQKIRFSGLIHETVAESIKNIDGVVGKTDIAVHHYGHLDKITRSRKTDYYLDLGLKQIELTPDNPKPYYDIGIIYLNEGDFIKAEKYFLKTIELKTDYLDVEYNMALLYFKWHKFEESLKYLNALSPKKMFKEDCMLLRASVLDWMQDYGQAAHVLEHCIERYPAKKFFKEFIALIYMKNADFQMAKNWYGELHNAEPDNTNYILGLMQAKFYQGDPQSAYDLFKQAEKNMPLPEQIYLWAMVICAKLNLTDDLQKYLRMAQDKNFLNMDLSYFKGVLEESEGSLKQAVEYYKQALQTTAFLAAEINQRIMNIINPEK